MDSFWARDEPEAISDVEDDNPSVDWADKLEVCPVDCVCCGEASPTSFITGDRPKLRGGAGGGAICETEFNETQETCGVQHVSCEEEEEEDVA